MSFTWFADKPLFTREQWMRTFIEVADELDMPDKRGACICAAMCAFQEAGADPHKTGQRQIWIPGNNNDPAFRGDPNRFRHDSMGDDGASTGGFQQQAGANWGWGGNLGDPEGTRKRMDPRESTRMFMGHAAAGLKRKGYNASNAQAAGDSIQRVQGSSFPRAYDKWWDEANRLYDAMKGNPAPAPSPPPPPARPAIVVQRVGDPVWLPDVLRAEGLTVNEVPGWRERGHGDFGEIRGIMAHHTGSNNASPESIAFHPSLGLASQLHLARNGVWTVCGVGIAWHAGNGGGIPWLPNNDANRFTIGIEAANDGGGTPGKPHRSSWPAEQYDSYVRGCAAILRKIGQG